MSGRRPRLAAAVLVRLAAAFLAAALVVPAAAPAKAEGLLQAIFGAFGRPAPRPLPPQTQSYAPSGSPFDFLNPPSQERIPPNTTGRNTVFCVRSCDGRYFPVENRAGLSAAQACHAFCPASAARTFSGMSIDHAVASDGTRYADLENAFVYRKKVVPGCTCNGRDAFGLARIDVADDPTLHAGDVVATTDGFMAYGPRRHAAGAYTPVDSYPGLSAQTRETLSQTRVLPAPVAAVDVPQPSASITPAATLGTAAILPPRLDQQAQLVK